MKNIRDLLSRYISGLTWNCLWIFLFIAGFGAFFIGMPKYYDDYMFMVHLRPWFAEQGVEIPENGGNIFKWGIPWDAIFDTWVEHYKEDNIRIPNLLITFFLMFPKWLGSGLMTLLWGWTVISGFKFSAVNWRYSPLVPPAMALWMFFMPWRCYFGAMDYQFNYILSTWMALQLLLWLRRCEIYNNGLSSPQWTRFISGFCFGIVAGMCHEGISVPLAAGLFMLVVCRRIRDVRTYGAICGLIIGAIVLLTVPGMRYREDHLIHSQNLLWVIQNLKMDGVAMWIYTVLLFLTIVRKGWKCLINDRIILFVCVNIIVSLSILFYCGALGRACFWLDFICITGSIYIFRMNFKKCTEKYSATGIIIAIPILMSVYVHQMAVGYYSLKLRKLQQEVMCRYVDNPEGYMFGNILTLDKAPLVCGYLPDSNFVYTAMFNVRWYFNFGQKYWKCCEVIFPEELRYIDGTQGDQVAGDGSVREIAGIYYAPLESVGGRGIADNDYVSLWMDFGKGYVHVGCAANVFRSERDGKEYVWLLPAFDWYVSHFKMIKRIRSTNPDYINN